MVRKRGSSRPAPLAIFLQHCLIQQHDQPLVAVGIVMANVEVLAGIAEHDRARRRERSAPFRQIVEPA